MTFGIKEWYHTHRVKILNGNQCLIIDEIHFQTGNKLFDKITKCVFTRDMNGRSKGYKNFFES
jgi:ligand-binding SRPBCC domain-containing protein